MADQKALKKRLKVLMTRPENQVCSDCPERQPRWASLIVPPPDAPPNTLPIGAFCCLECSGSHRRLGVHISFVRSINLDSWKEKEVLAMENGGNARVNTIFEARLPNPSMKPPVTADGRTRERFIRDKYERRKYYDAAGFSLSPAPAPTAVAAPSSSSIGAPSDAAKKRMEQRRTRTKVNTERPAQTSSRPSRREPERPPPPAVAAAPVDLLDFSAAPTPAAPAPAAQSDLGSFFEATTTKPDLARHVSSAAHQGSPVPKKKEGADIMSLYNNVQQQQPQSFGDFGDFNSATPQPNTTGMMMNNNPTMMGNGGMMPMQGNGGVPMNGGMPMNGGGPMMMMNGGGMAMANGGGFPMNSAMPGGPMAMPMPMMGGMPQQNMQQMSNMMQNMRMAQQQPQMMNQQQQVYQQQMRMMQQQQQQQHMKPQTDQLPKQPQVPEKDDPFAQFGTNMFR